MERAVNDAIYVFMNRARRRMSEIMSGYGQTGMQGRIIHFLYRQTQEREICQRDIEEEFGLRASSVTGLLQLLEKNGYIRRESVAGDARLKKILLTPKAIEIQEKIAQEMALFEKELQEGCTEQEIDFFFEMMRRFTENVRESGHCEEHLKSTLNFDEGIESL